MRKMWFDLITHYMVMMMPDRKAKLTVFIVRHIERRKRWPHE